MTELFRDIILGFKEIAEIENIPELGKKADKYIEDPDFWKDEDE